MGIRIVKNMIAKKILIIAAHPDDELLGCGGAIVKYLSQGCAIKVLFLGEGSSCRYDNPSCASSHVDIEKRNLSASQALHLIGVEEFEFYNLPCGRFDQTPIIEINKIIEQAIKAFKPDTVFTHSDVDSNNDHKITYRSSIMATRPCGEHVVKQVFCYEVLSSSEWSYTESFLPNFFIALNERQLVSKWEALELYQGEMRDYPFPRSWLGVKTQAMHRGTQAGVEYAEAFRLVRGFD
tara:strand:- start:70 stop:780 length:711 start_codon:yes stop_codon:yes gene_type:complete